MPSDSYMKATVFDDGESSMPLRRREEKKDEIIELDAGLQILTSHPSIWGDYEMEFGLTPSQRAHLGKGKRYPLRRLIW